MTKERNERFKRICQRAHEIWESEGRPLGSHDVFWLAAMAEIDATSPDSLMPSTGDTPMSRAVMAMDDLASEQKMHISRL